LVAPTATTPSVAMTKSANSSRAIL
jgi:hypothetical protein